MYDSTTTIRGVVRDWVPVAPGGAKPGNARREPKLRQEGVARGNPPVPPDSRRRG